MLHPRLTQWLLQIGPPRTTSLLYWLGTPLRSPSDVPKLNMSKTVHSFLKPANFPDQENITVIFSDTQLTTKMWSSSALHTHPVYPHSFHRQHGQPSSPLSCNTQGTFCYYHKHHSKQNPIWLSHSLACKPRKAHLSSKDNPNSFAWNNRALV